MTSAQAEPRRKDARRNRTQILDVARALLAERGLAVDMREIAAACGVGVGTLYRHFPDRDRLLTAVLAEDAAVWTEATEPALADADAWRGLRAFAEATLSLMARHRGMLDGLSGPETQAAFDACRDHLAGVIGDLVGRAQEDGRLRRDVSAHDVVVQVMALGRAVELTEAAEPGAWRRHLEIVLDGLAA
ncbi:TetR/AcrR family transcriptional regulator [Phytomonospora endophytica]|uniref:AcrR family transcriptional regulator n=1 Tax=Phytomonospora endophytica TaxID=714109 RepID=A0A841FMP6_9ACTN|nr:TetR/AcrR family transcriptional regulator [Phytomonospora endophytica]MBB6034822.1 AcrR family transcriptional regulator [Phytomonospora endophytica]GIG68974.1 TetR family transcriptional regulator [Phytomonospora endophytica]